MSRASACGSDIQVLLFNSPLCSPGLGEAVYNRHKKYRSCGLMRCILFGHICRMPDGRLLELLLHGQVAKQNCRGKPRTVWNNVVLSDVHKLKLNHYTRDAQNKPVWRELTCVART